MRYTLLEYMPEHLRASHLAARNSGVYPHNGAIRVYVEGEFKSNDLDPQWCSVIEDSIREVPQDEPKLTQSELPCEVWRPIDDSGGEDQYD